MSRQEAITRRFRDIFLSCLDTSYSNEERDELLRREQHHLLVHLPTKTLAPHVQADTAVELLNTIDEVYKEASPDDVHRHGLSVPTEILDSEHIDLALRKRLLTIVVFPGIFSEFIEAGSFDKVFDRNDSNCARRWYKTLADSKDRFTEAEREDSLHDDQFSLNLLDSDAHESPYVKRRLDDLIDVASIDGADGEPLVQVVRFKHDLMSMETFGNIEGIAEILTRRLHKFFTLLGIPDNLVLLGYSMGTPVALEALAKAYAKNASWVSRVRAVVSVGGVVYGSHAADDAISPTDDRRNNSSHMQVQALRTLESTLRQTRGLHLFQRKPIGRSKLSTLISNTKAWLAFGTAWADSVKEMVDSGAKIPIPKLIRIGRKVDVKPVLGLVAKIGIGTFSLFNPLCYSSNVRKFRRLVRAALTGIESLTTEARRQWWTNNILPTSGIRYYAVAGTMSDPSTKPESPELNENAVAGNPDSLDYQILLNGYRGIVESSGQQLNDGQMAVVRAQFWPDLAQLHNPTYARTPLRTAFLGVLASHHWGLTLPEVNAMHSGPNPFPRAALLKALAAQVAFDLDSREGLQ